MDGALPALLVHPDGAPDCHVPEDDWSGARDGPRGDDDAVGVDALPLLLLPAGGRDRPDAGPPVPEQHEVLVPVTVEGGAVVDGVGTVVEAGEVLHHVVVVVEGRGTAGSVVLRGAAGRNGPACLRGERDDSNLAWIGTDDRERFPGARERTWNLDRPSARRELFIDKPRRPRAVEAGEPVHGHAYGCRSTKLDVDVTVLCTHAYQLPLRLGSAIECLFELCNQQGRDGGKAVDVDDVRVRLSKYVPHRGAVRFAHRAAERHGCVRTEPVAGGTADLLRQVRLDAVLRPERPSFCAGVIHSLGPRVLNGSRS